MMATNYLFGDLEVGEHVRLREPHVVSNHHIIHQGQITKINWARRNHTYDLLLEGGKSLINISRSGLWKLTPKEIAQLQATIGPKDNVQTSADTPIDNSPNQSKATLTLSQHLQTAFEKESKESTSSLKNHTTIDLSLSGDGFEDSFRCETCLRMFTHESNFIKHFENCGLTNAQGLNPSTVVDASNISDAPRTEGIISPPAQRGRPRKDTSSHIANCNSVVFDASTEDAPVDAPSSGSREVKSILSKTKPPKTKSFECPGIATYPHPITHSLTHSQVACGCSHSKVD